MIEGISIINCQNSSREYLLKVYTKDAVGSLFSRVFCLKWDDEILLRKRRVEIEYNEIRIFLRKGDDIQKYIDCVTRIYNHVESYIEKKSARKKQVVLKKVYPANYRRGV